MDCHSVDAVGIAGAGRLGSALGRLLVQAGETIVAVASRDPERAALGAQFAGEGVLAVSYERLPALARRILIAVSDDAIAEVAGVMAAVGMDSGVALHLCGAKGPEELSCLADQGVSVGVLHPLQTIPTPELGVRALRHISWGVTAEGPSAEWAAAIVSALDGRTLMVPASKRALYHAAGVTACNYFVGLMDAATALMEAAGIDRASALQALEPMVEATRQNTFQMGPAEALTGPILRGDYETVERHLTAIAQMPATIRDLFRAAGLHTLSVARVRGLDEDKAQQLETLLRDNSTRNA